MKKVLITGILITAVLAAMSDSAVIAAPVGMENINEDHYSGSGVSCENSSDPLACKRYENINLDSFGDYSKWCRTYTFPSDNHLYEPPDLLADMKIDSGIVLDEYSENIRPESAPVPEPETLTLIGLGLVSAGIMLRKRLFRNCQQDES